MLNGDIVDKAGKVVIVGERSSMIASLTGTIQLKTNSYLILDVHGVGYKVFVSNAVLSKSGTAGDRIMLYTYMHVREDALELYGFPDVSDLQLFEYLIEVSGVGCKTALGVFSVGTRQEIIHAIINADVHFFTSVPRLGKKNAQKIIIELKNKLGGIDSFDQMLSEGDGQSDALDALRAFGFSTQEAQKALHAVSQDAETPEQQIKLALKYLGGRKVG